METAADRVEVAIQGKDAFVRVFGRATFKIGPSLTQFGNRALEYGCCRIIVEMRDCVGMDSTFMGVLAGLSSSLKKTSGEVVLRNLNEKNLFLLKMVGLTHLVRIDTEALETVPAPGAGETLASVSTKQNMTETMINAHEALIEAAPENIVKFKDVLAFLKEDLKRTTAQQPFTPSPP